MYFPSPVDFAVVEWNHVLIIGQSNAMGHGGTPPISTTPSGYNRMFEGGVLQGCADSTETFFKATDYSRIRGLKEENGHVLWSPLAAETLASGFANYVAFKTGGAHRLLMSISARGGSAYATLSKGTAPYNRGIRHIREAHQAQPKLGMRIKPSAILSVHGEADNTDPTYGTMMTQWQSDYQTEINGLTGRTGTLPMFHSQPSWDLTSPASIALYELHKAAPTLNPLGCPKYALPYVGGADMFHLTNLGHRLMGAYYGKPYVQQVVLRQQWEPLRPSGVSRVGAAITITFTGNVGSLVLDTTTVTNPGNFGFSYTDDSSPPAIQSVALQGSNQVVVTLASTPSGANKKIRYAYSSGSQFSGPTTGRRGNLRDSDPDKSPYGESLPNWCVHFEEVVA